MTFIINPFIYAQQSLVNAFSPDAYWSVMLVSDDYSGALVKLRRSSDSTEKVFYPDSSGELSMSSEDGAGTSLSTWVGSNSAYVSVFYDQSGNSLDLTQTATGKQPRVVNAGTLETLNGKACFQFDGTDDWLTGGTILNPNGLDVLFTTAVISNTGSQDTVYARARFASVDGRYAMYGGASNQVLVENSGGVSLVAGGSGAGVWNQQWDGSNHGVYKNNNVQGSPASKTGTMGNLSSRFLVGAYNNAGDTGEQAGYFYPYKMQELGVWLSDQSANRTDINNNINNRFSIY